jgi:uncharacterized protein
MTSLIFPDVNVWLALSTDGHLRHGAARLWWERHPGRIAFSRFTQLGFLRLTTTAAAVKGTPLTIDEAWRVYDRLYDDDRVVFVLEPPESDKHFRRYASARAPSPKLWADAWLLAVAEAAAGTVVTFDRALARRSHDCVLLV